MDTGVISVEVHEPQLRLVGHARLRFDAFALQWRWRQKVRWTQQWHSRLPPMRHVESDIWWQRPVHDGCVHRVTPLHGDDCSERNGNCSPTRAASSSRWRRRAVAVWTNSLEARARVQHMRTHQNGICSSFSTVHDHHRQQTIGRTFANTSNKSQNA